jgi:uncharacterized cupin superfamily protein
LSPERVDFEQGQSGLDPRPPLAARPRLCDTSRHLVQGSMRAMPKLDIAAIPVIRGVGYPAPFAAACAHRLRQRLGAAGGLKDFGVNLMRLPPGEWSSQRHWHSHEDELVYVLEGELVLVEDGGETLLRAGDCAAFPKASGDGHHMINRSSAVAVYLEVGSRHPDDLTTCSDIDLMSANSDGRFVHKDGSPYPEG